VSVAIRRTPAGCSPTWAAISSTRRCTSSAPRGACTPSSIIIAIIFQTQNDRFLAAGNFVNLIVQTAPYAVIAMGVTFALLGEIDLSSGKAWILAIVCVVLYTSVLLARQRSRRAAGLELDPVLIVVLHIVALAVALAVIVGVANQDRGVPYAGLVVVGLFIGWTFVLNRTKFGRHIYAVGGNAEAARRAGINVDNVRIACFAIVSFMAVLGGIILASRLRSVDTNTGGGQALLYPIAAAVIGGTSLFGGRGTMKAALLGAVVMLSIDNGLGLLGLSSGTKFVLTGGVLLLAVTVDSISRRGREASGRA
jgi:D-xylose transport system permease protein